MNYLNPASFMPTADFRVNPLQGAFAGMGLGATEQLLDRSFRDSDLSYLEQLHKFEMDKAKDPQTLAEIAAATAEAKNKKTMAEDPLTLAAARSGLSTQIDSNDTKKVMNSQAREGARNALTVQMNEEFQKNPLTPDSFVKNPQEASRRWGDWQQRFKEVGIILPNQPTPDFLASLPAKARAAMMNLQYQQDLGKIAAQNEGSANVADITGKYGVKRAEISAQAQRDTAGTNAASRERIAQTARADKEGLAHALVEIAQSGDPGAIRAARNLAALQAQKLAEQELQADLNATVLQMQDPNKYEELRKQKQARIMQEFNTIIDNAVKAKGQSPAAAPTAPTTGNNNVVNQPSNIPAGAIDMLKKNPGLKDAFDQKYGAGSADKVLNGK